MNLLSPIDDLGDIDAPLLVFGGPYSNLAATQALLNAAISHDIPPERIICTGDVVAYAAEPNQTSDLIRTSGMQVVMGNCEESLALERPDCGCGFDENTACSIMSVSWYSYANKHISAVNRHWMHTLPRLIQCKLNGLRCCFVHGSASSINQFIFASTNTHTKQQQLTLTQSDIIVGGHCGIPFGQTITREDAQSPGLWVNAGVIGMPANDGTPDGWYMLLEPCQATANVKAGIKISWHRLQYNYQQTLTNMQTAGVNDYANAMPTGLWPSMDVLPASERQQQGKPIDLSSMYLSPMYYD